MAKKPLKSVTGSPRFTILRTQSGCSRTKKGKLPNSLSLSFIRAKNKRQTTTCEINVAKAAPAVPISKAKISTGSSTKFKIKPMLLM